MSFPSRPSPAPTDVIERIASIGPVAKCLEWAIKELEEEDKVNHPTRPTFDSSMKELLLKRYKDSVAELSWDDAALPVTKDSSAGPLLKCPPPAGLLSGKLQYYNRVGGQWRIVLSDAELCPRIRSDDADRTKNRVSLWDYSEQSSLGKDDKMKLGNVVILAYDDL